MSRNLSDHIWRIPAELFVGAIFAADRWLHRST